MLKKRYETERLTLLLSEPALAARVAAFYRRNQAFYAPTEPVREAEFYTEAFQRRALAQDLRSAKRLWGLRMWLVPKEDEAADILGMASLGSIFYGAFCSAFLSYKLDEGATGQGYMAEALQKLIEVAFGPLELHRLEANILPDNAPSLRVVEKLGFQNEGLARKYLNIGGVWRDHIHMVLLSEDVA
ncbi:GNAT family N-acetyltransferase [Ruminococcaceae bacterium OttesenSCG-928-O06]|nr:GNAT family N-acetyltransferase [Ruminococcaceae bacterium OttesenSCG-928-O06]